MTGVSSSCGACKFLRRRCTNECIFAPYFSYEEAGNHFAAIHKVFGASNVSKLLSCLPMNSRSDAAITISYEALARMHDPVYGCVAHIFALQQQVASLEEEIEIIGNQMANHGTDIVGCDPYNFASQSEIFTENYNNIQHILPIHHSGSASANQSLCSHTDPAGIEDSSIFERLLGELNQDYYQLEEIVSRDYINNCTYH